MKAIIQKSLFAIMVLSMVSSCSVSKKSVANDRQITVEKVWDKAPHSAFTDLIKFKGNYYCVFREAPRHVSGPTGIARVLISKDAKNWIDADSVKLENQDVRDPKITVTPWGRLMILFDGEAYKNGKIAQRSPYFSISDANGRHFGAPQKSTVDPAISENDDWVWRLTWYKGIGYGIDYQKGKVYLVRTKDGHYFENIAKLDVDGFPNESTIRFDKNGKIYVLIRRDMGDRMGILATADNSFKNWVYQKMDRRIGGPNFLFLNDSTICIGSRLYPTDKDLENKVKFHKTAIFIANLKGEIKKVIPIEQSGGDNSYPGMILEKNELLMSYYSSHEGKTSIYLARVPVSLLK